jgi:long-chain acyl-CoA synthetase
VLTLPSMLERTLRLYGAAPAVVDDERNFTWREFVDRVARAAAVLQGCGVTAGAHYAVLCRNGFRNAELIHAGYWLGAVAVPLNYRLAPAEIAAILTDSQCRLIAAEDRLAPILDDAALAPWRARVLHIGTAAQGPHYEALMAAAVPIPAHDAREQDTAILLYTGGTTGRAKGVPLSHGNLVANAMQLAFASDVRSDDLHLQVSPMFHSTYLKGNAYTLVGAAHSFLPEFSPEGVLAAIERYRVTMVSLVPTTIHLTAQAGDFAHYDISSLRRILYGTSPIPAEWLHLCMERFHGVGFQQGYGLTETSPILTTLGPEMHEDALTSGRHERLAAAGWPLPGVDIRILDQAGHERPRGAAGEVAVRGPQVVRGYHNRPEETAAAFRDGWFLTGDIGRLDEDGLLYILDRKNDMIVTGGENVYASEVEAVLYRHADVREAAVIGVPDARFGEALFAVVVAREGARPSKESIIAHCRQAIGGYKIPRNMVFVEQLPKSALGKILKSELRRRYGDEAARPPTG